MLTSDHCAVVACCRRYSLSRVNQPISALCGSPLSARLGALCGSPLSARLGALCGSPLSARFSIR